VLEIFFLHFFFWGGGVGVLNCNVFKPASPEYQQLLVGYFGSCSWGELPGSLVTCLKILNGFQIYVLLFIMYTFYRAFSLNINCSSMLQLRNYGSVCFNNDDCLI
jgi:hypothetical protein